jgi:hypothetical protein
MTATATSWAEAVGATSAIGVPVGRLVVNRVPLLRSHAGRAPDLVLKWSNVQSTTSDIDVVVHLHGYSLNGGAMNLLREKLPISGLDFADPVSGRPGRVTPTVAILPRGHHARATNTRRSEAVYTFPVLATPHGLNDLIDLSLAHVRTATGASNLRRRRLVLTAHSGGGAAVEAALPFNDPDEVHIFDGVYSPSPNVIRWAKRRISCEQAGCPRPWGALRVLFLAGSQTQSNSLAVRHGIAAQLSTGLTGLARRYRVEAVRVRGVQHLTVPPTYGWRLLADPAGNVPLTGRLPARHPEVATLNPRLAGTFTPVPVECPGGGRVKKKRPPAAANLVEVKAYGRRTVPLHRTAAIALSALIAAARADGIPEPLLRPISGYRSPEHQAALWRSALAKYGSAAVARRWVAPPGSSAHQSGRAVDLNLGRSLSGANIGAMRATPAYAWLVANAQLFGFYQYPAEPWHWEYNPPNPRCGP